MNSNLGFLDLGSSHGRQWFKVLITFKVIVSAKPPYRSNLNAPQVALTPHQTINPPFRPSRKILSKEELSGGSIVYRLGPFLPHGTLANHGFPEVIQVSATEIDDHVSHQELERFEHADFELHVAREIEADQAFENRQMQALLRRSLGRGRGRPRKHTGAGAALVHRERGMLGNIYSVNHQESDGSTSDTSTSEDEGTANNDAIVGRSSNMLIDESRDR